MQVKNFKIIIVFCLSIFIVSCQKINIMKEKKLTITLIDKPRSTDPLDYDYSIHHNVMRSVYASLVSVYKNGEITPQVAKSWKTNSNHTLWELEIDNAWTFLNGDRITPDIILKNFKRVIVVKNKSKSESGLLEFLVGAKDLLNLSDDFEGIKVKENTIVFQFIKPMPDFLTKISFGLYGIAHPADYNLDGSWKNKKAINSSGIYYIKSWTDEHVILERRNVSFIDSNNKVIKLVKFIFPNDQSQVEDSLMIFLDRLNPKLNENDWEFVSSALNNKMIYMQVMNWDDPKSAFSSLEFRKTARSAFYKSLIESGMQPETSFFPKTINGVSSFELEEFAPRNNFIKKLRTQPFVTSDYKKTGLKKTRADFLAEAFYGLANKLNAIPEINQYPENEEDEKKVFDLQYLGTGIDIFSPDEDIRFMFKSKHGIKLPDSTGEIKKIIENDFLVQVVNQKLWDQAIIWPVLHYSTGFWIKKNSNLDISSLNISLTPIDFQFVRWN